MAINRDAYERKLARALGRLDAETRRELLALLGDPPTLDALTPQVWEEIARRYEGAVMPVLEETFLAVLQDWIESGVAVSWDMANERAIQWAGQYTYELVRGMNATAQERLSTAIRHFYEGRLDLDGVARRMNSLFSPQRAEMIAITEVTRASVQATNWYERELNELGVRTERIWRTANDEIVCPICGPNSSRRESDGWTVAEPPAHPRCRCWLTVEPIPMEVVAP